MRVKRRIPIARGIPDPIDPQESGTMAVHLAGIFTLERTARESREDHIVIMGMLADYIREKAAWIGDRTTQPPITPFPIDLQTVLTVICRRKREYERGKDLNVSLVRTDLRGAYLVSGHLEEVIFSDAHLEGAQLSSARLERAVFTRAHLEGAWLRYANLQGAVFENAHLEGAHLNFADLTGTHFLGTHLEGADLRGAKGLTLEQLQRVFYDETTQLPEEIVEQLTPEESETKETGSTHAKSI